MNISVFLIAFVFEIALAIEFPSYIPRCSLSDPYLEKCLIKSGNIAIPKLVEGDPEVGFPILSPLHIPKLELKVKNLEILLSDIYTDGLKNIRIASALYDQEKQFLFYGMTLDVLTITGKYYINNGRLHYYPVSGSGKFNITLVANTLNYTGDVVFYNKNDELHDRLVNSALKLGTSRAYYDFQDLQAFIREIDLNAFINKNWQMVFAEIKLAIEDYFLSIFQKEIDVVTETFPYFVFLKY